MSESSKLPSSATESRERFLKRDRLQDLFDLLRADGRTVVGPTLSQEAIVYEPIDTVDELPCGWTDIQEAGKYRLIRRDDDRLFGYVVGPHSWKRFLYPPHSILSSAKRTEDGWEFQVPEQDAPRYAFLGVRACELAAIDVQDRTFLGGGYVDPVYASRRSDVFLIAVNCTQASANCFCTSMNTGPRCRSGFDLALTELADGFTVETGSEAGERLLSRLVTSEAEPVQLDAAETARQQAVEQISKTLDTAGIRELLMGNLEHSRWDEVATRCLSCTNCTMVCPTCFCSSVEEVSDLSGEHVERHRHWDSCFNPDFSFLHGGLVRNGIRSRYRQWLTHKLATWHDQFGTSGCVGCGRCITWCPVGIDLTEEVAAIREQQP